MLFAAVHRSLLALRVIRRDAPFWSLTAHSGHWPVLALNASVVNDPNLRVCPETSGLITEFSEHEAD
jgi:hypothetical protein